jgi:hypothetical protein
VSTRYRLHHGAVHTRPLSRPSGRALWRDHELASATLPQAQRYLDRERLVPATEIRACGHAAPRSSMGRSRKT